MEAASLVCPEGDGTPGSGTRVDQMRWGRFTYLKAAPARELFCTNPLLENLLICFRLWALAFHSLA